MNYFHKINDMNIMSLIFDKIFNSHESFQMKKCFEKKCIQSFLKNIYFIVD